MNTSVILGLIILVIICGISVYHFLKLDKKKKIANIKQWLKLAVVEAEKVLGGGTGQLKLRYVYDLAVKQFEIFSGGVDEALEWMKEQLEQNKAINNYIKN